MPSPLANNELPDAPPLQVPTALVAAPPATVAVAQAIAPPRIVQTAEELRRFAKSFSQRRVSSAWKWCEERLTDLAGDNVYQSSFSISAIVHAVLVILLGLLLAPVRHEQGPSLIVATVGEEAPAPSSLVAASAAVSGDGVEFVPAAVVASDVAVENLRQLRDARPTAHIVPWDFGMDENTSRHWYDKAEANPYSNLDGRNPQYRESLIGKLGGPTRSSEQAVENGLRWLAAHQRLDGSWHFDLTKGPCKGLCRHSGNVGSTTAATSMALLAFLGAGNTPHQGEYREVVRKGLYYLQKRMITTPYGGDYQDGTQYGMYAQGLTAIALCEAYILTRDRELARYAQPAVDFIAWAQDSKGGGWRYTPGEPGDTTVTAWQVMALKSARAAYLRVPTQATANVQRFLDGVQSEDGAYYGYMSSGKEPTTTAVGLLSRMLLGWPRNQPALVKGVRYLAKRGPSRNDIYYNYYATQALHHFGGQEWIVWNETMRDYLVESQASEGHENGSWQFDDDHESGSKGGRLYNTCMAIMTLEVYYRYLPIYGDDTFETPIVRPGRK